MKDKINVYVKGISILVIVSINGKTKGSDDVEKMIACNHFLFSGGKGGAEKEKEKNIEADRACLHTAWVKNVIDKINGCIIIAFIVNHLDGGQSSYYSAHQWVCKECSKIASVCQV